MSQSKNNNNNEWRKVFEKAVESPPPNVWDAIEKRLDENLKAKPLIAPWWQRYWLAAASVLVVLGVGTIILLVNRTQSPQEIVANLNVKSNPVQSSKATSNVEPQTFAQIEESSTGEARSAEHNAIQPSLTSDPKTSVALDRNMRSPAESKSPNLVTLQTFASETVADAKKVDIEHKSLFSNVEWIEPSPVQELKTYWQRRYIFYNPYANESVEDDLPKSESSTLWAAVSFMPGGFNPNMEFNHQSVYQMDHALSTSGFTNGMYANNRSVTGNRDQPKISYQASAQVGINLSKNWTLESGISYLQGNSTSRSPGFFLNKMTQESADLLPNALMYGKANYSPETIEQLQLDNSIEGYSTVFVPMDKNMDNNYQFLQVPLMGGYTFRPEKKFSYTMLAGGITNIFLTNKLETMSGFVLETKPENNVYNPLGISAAAGVRVNYRINNAWYTNLSANYQHSLTDSFKDNPFLKSKPQVYGISWGVRYTFQN